MNHCLMCTGHLGNSIPSWMASSQMSSTGFPVPKLLHLGHSLHIPSALVTTLRQTTFVTSLPMPNNPSIMKSSMLSSTHKTRRKILTQCTENSTSREKFSTQTIFSCHWKQLLWPHSAECASQVILIRDSYCYILQPIQS